MAKTTKIKALSIAELQNKHLAVIGFGPKTGVSLCRFLNDHHIKHTAYDKRGEDELQANVKCLTNTAYTQFQFGTTEFDWLQTVDIVVTSPGVPLSEPVLQTANQLGLPIIAEVELASWLVKAPIIAITGTNGKTTTTSMIANLLRHAGQKTFVGGNIGYPFIEAVGKDFDYVVLELSSFQLETIHKLRPHVAIVLNISEDHLDRYGSIEAYKDAKKRIFMNQFPREWALVNGDDQQVLDLVDDCRATKVTFAIGDENAPVSYNNEAIVVKAAGENLMFSTRRCALVGQHNISNLMAMVACGMVLGIEPECIQQAIDAAKAPPHRLEVIATINKITFINDSKSTTLASTREAIRAIDQPFVLILGGRDKGAPFSNLADLCAKQNILKVIAYGEAAPRIEQALAEHTTVETKSTFDEAINAAFAAAPPGSAVLLSPAASSFDQFTNFEERGNRFRKLVEELAP